MTHAGMSQFVDEATQTVWNFTHPVFTDSSLQFYSQTPGCTCPTCGRNSCPAPQCANEFNLSPYGMWTFQISPEWYGRPTVLIFLATGPSPLQSCEVSNACFCLWPDVGGTYRTVGLPLGLTSSPSCFS